jgi:AbrB family looped-hinge helix DNA binding protein
MLESTVRVKGQTTLPREVRAALGLASGDRVRYIIVDGEVRILKARSVKELCGLLARPDQTPVTLESMDEAIVRGAAAGVNSELGS